MWAAAPRTNRTICMRAASSPNQDLQSGSRRGADCVDHRQPHPSRYDDLGGGAKGKERPLRHNGKEMELVWGGEGSSGPAVEWTAARSSSRPARTRVRWVPVGGVGRARRPGGGGTLCLALPTPRTDSSGAQGLWKVNLQPNHSQPRPKGVRARKASPRPVGLSPGGGGWLCGFCAADFAQQRKEFLKPRCPAARTRM